MRQRDLRNRILNRNPMIILAKTNCMISYPNVLMKIIKQIGITVAYAEHSHNPQLSVSDHREYLPV